MPIEHRPIPELPDRPRSQPITGEIRRSYPVGHQQFSRAVAGSAMEFTISAGDQFPRDFQATLVTTLCPNIAGDWMEFAFSRVDERTFVCRITPEHPGLYWLRARFSPDGGSTWLRDPVPDAWVMVDPPQVDAMRLYTLIPNVSGTLADWKAELRRIKDLGFNAVHLLPITTLDTSESPYAARDLFGIDPSYLANGNCDALCQLADFVEEAKTLGIRLCFDLVLNHVGVDSNMARCAPEWIVPDQNSPDGFKRARYWSDQGWLAWDDLVLIDYEHPAREIRAEIWAYMTEYALFWSKYAHYTNGFVRLDNLHSGDKGFLRALSKAMRTEYPELGIIAEYFTDDGTLLDSVPAWRLNLILATTWDRKFVPQLRDYLKYIHRISGQVRYFIPISSHDSGTPAQEFGASDSTIPRYVAVALLGTGATGITQGVEWGQPKKIEFIGKHPRLCSPKEPKYGKFIRKVNQILADYPTFRRGENCQFVDGYHSAVIAAFRTDEERPHSGFLVVCNFDVTNEQKFETDLSQVLATDGMVGCCDLLTGKVMSFTSPRLELTLKPCSALVLKF